MTVYTTVCYDVNCAPYTLGVFSTYEKAKSAVDDYFNDEDIRQTEDSYYEPDKTHYITKYDKKYDIYYEIKIVETTVDTPLN